MNALMTESTTSTIPGSKSPCFVMMLALAGSGTSTAFTDVRPCSWYESTTFSALHFPHNSEISTPVVKNAKYGILEIKRLSGLTWDELSKMFRVSRRSVHNWARGENVTADNETKILSVLEKTRKIHLAFGSTTASRLRSLKGDAPLYTLLAGLPHSALDERDAVALEMHKDAPVDAVALMANWRPVAPFRDRWEDDPIEDVVPVGRYPVKRLKVATKRLG